MADYDCFWWMELIGFDNRDADMGVKHLLDKAGFKPGAVVLLLWSNDFIHSHEPGLPDSTMLREDCSSYVGQLKGLEHDRQHWSQGQLKTLVRELQKNGIAVYFSVFDQLMNDEIARRFKLENLPETWTDRHPEMRYVDIQGNRIEAICPWKRLADGTFYEDFFIGKLRQVMLDYGFDGFHGADGYIHQRIPIYDGDFSDDLIEQSGLGLPAGAIWRERRHEWIEFHGRRQREFWQKTNEMLRGIDKKLIVNSIWTRDPFESRYRYGCDVRAINEIGADAVILEAPGTVLALENWGSKEVRPLYKFMPSLLRLTAAMPEMRISFMSGLKDVLEEYNSIEHDPVQLEAELVALTNCFVYRGGAWQRALQGMLGCLTSHLTAGEWHWIKRRWDMIFAEAPPRNCAAAAVVWSAVALDRELEAYARAGRFTSAFHLHWLLLAGGAPVNTIVDICDLKDFTGPVVVLNRRFMPADELEMLSAYRGGEVISCECETVDNSGTDPHSWLVDLPEPEPPAGTVRGWVEQIRTAVPQIPGLVSGEAHLLYADNKLTLINDLNHYQRVKVQLPFKPTRITGCLNSLIPITPDETITVKLPPKGAVILEII